MNNYTKAVDYLEEITRAFQEAAEMNTLSLPNIETGIEFAFKILKESPEYANKFTTQ